MRKQPDDTLELEAIHEAAERIRPRIPPTPLLRAWEIEEALGRRVYLKCELFNVTGSFKPRGALNWMLTARADELERGLATISAGNHALALAWAARAAGAHVKVVMPEGSSPVKIESTRALGAEVVLHGDINAAMVKLDEILTEEGRVLVHPFNDRRVMAGAGTVGLEIAEAVPDLGAICCPVGGGGLVSGIARAVKGSQPDARIIGLEPEGAATLRRAWDAGGPVRLERVDTIAASLGASLAGELSYTVSREWVDDVVTVSDDEIRAGLRAALTGCKLYAEPGAVLGLAALLRRRVTPEREGPLVAVITGGNMDLSLARSLLEEQ